MLERHPQHALIFSVAVAPAFQRKGLGIALLRHAEHQADEWVVPELRLYTNARMERNIALYSGLRLSGDGPPVQPLSARLDAGRHGEDGRRGLMSRVGRWARIARTAIDLKYQIALPERALGGNQE